MPFLGKLFRYVDVMGLDISMSYYSLTGTGSAAVQWIPLSDETINLRPILICLLYARVLTITVETRAKLFWLIDELGKSNVRDQGQTGFPFPEWALEIGHGAPPQHIWPWGIYDNPNDLIKPKVYRATLETWRKGYFDIHLKMAFGLDRVLTPSAALIAIHSYCLTVDQKGCYELALCLWQINEFYQKPENIRIGKESLALNTAMNVIRSGNLNIP